MSIVKEYIDENTKIRVHSDYINEDSKNTKELIISLVINYLKNRNI